MVHLDSLHVIRLYRKYLCNVQTDTCNMGHVHVRSYVDTKLLHDVNVTLHIV